MDDARKRQHDAREAAIIEIRQRNLLGLSKSYHAKQVVYLSSVPDTCLDDNEPLDYVKKVHIPHASESARIAAWCCFRCGTAYLVESDRKLVEKRIKKAESHESRKAAWKASQKVTADQDLDEVGQPEMVNFTTSNIQLYLCDEQVNCNQLGHDLEEVSGALLGKDDAVIRIEVKYCTQCQKYHIYQGDYRRYREKHGVLLGNIKIANGYYERPSTEQAEESILHLCGYSVGKTDNLSAKERQGILSYLIDSKISSKQEIISYLSYFIRRNGSRANMDDAVRKWAEDIKWVQNYQRDRQRISDLRNIPKKK